MPNKVKLLEFAGYQINFPDHHYLKSNSVTSLLTWLSWGFCWKNILSSSFIIIQIESICHHLFSQFKTFICNRIRFAFFKMFWFKVQSTLEDEKIVKDNHNKQACRYIFIEFKFGIPGALTFIYESTRDICV